MWMQLGLECVQSGSGELAAAPFGASIKSQCMRHSYDHHVDWNFDAREVEKVPCCRRRTERPWPIQLQIGTRNCRRAVVRPRTWIDQQLPMMDAPDDERAGKEMEWHGTLPTRLVDQQAVGKPQY